MYIHILWLSDYVHVLSDAIFPLLQSVLKGQQCL